MDGAVPHLLGLLKSEESDIREAAVSAITEISKKSKLSLLVYSLVLIPRFSAYLVMVIKGAIPDLLRLLTDEDAGVRSVTIFAINEISKQGMVSLMSTLLS
jgi:HEAT repeat protein